MNIEAAYLEHGQRLALQAEARWSSARNAARAAMVGIDVEGRGVSALSSRALVSAFIASRESH
jgi:hypothetical protein